MYLWNQDSKFGRLVTDCMNFTHLISFMKIRFVQKCWYMFVVWVYTKLRFRGVFSSIDNICFISSMMVCQCHVMADYVTFPTSGPWNSEMEYSPNNSDSALFVLNRFWQNLGPLLKV